MKKDNDGTTKTTKTTTKKIKEGRHSNSTTSLPLGNIVPWQPKRKRSKKPQAPLPQHNTIPQLSSSHYFIMEQQPLVPSHHSTITTTTINTNNNNNNNNSGQSGSMKRKRTEEVEEEANPFYQTSKKSSAGSTSSTTIEQQQQRKQQKLQKKQQKQKILSDIIQYDNNETFDHLSDIENDENDDKKSSMLLFPGAFNWTTNSSHDTIHVNKLQNHCVNNNEEDNDCFDILLDSEVSLSSSSSSTGLVDPYFSSLFDNLEQQEEQQQQPIGDYLTSSSRSSSRATVSDTNENDGEENDGEGNDGVSEEEERLIKQRLRRSMIEKIKKNDKNPEQNKYYQSVLLHDAKFELEMAQRSLSKLVEQNRKLVDALANKRVIVTPPMEVLLPSGMTNHQRNDSLDGGDDDDDTEDNNGTEKKDGKETTIAIDKKNNRNKSGVLVNRSRQSSNNRMISINQIMLYYRTGQRPVRNEVSIDMWDMLFDRNGAGVSNLGKPIVVWDTRTFNLIGCNEAFRNLSQYSLDTLKNNFSILQLVPKNTEPIWRTLLEWILQCDVRLVSSHSVSVFNDQKDHFVRVRQNAERSFVWVEIERVDYMNDEFIIDHLTVPQTYAIPYEQRHSIFYPIYQKTSFQKFLEALWQFKSKTLLLDQDLNRKRMQTIDHLRQIMEAKPVLIEHEASKSHSLKSEPPKFKIDPCVSNFHPSEEIQVQDMTPIASSPSTASFLDLLAGRDVQYMPQNESSVTIEHLPTTPSSTDSPQLPESGRFTDLLFN